MSELADALHTPPIARGWANTIHRYAGDLRLGNDWALACAARLHADLAPALRALQVLAQLDARHQPRPLGPGSPTVVCTCGRGSYDACPDRALLNGARTVMP